MYNIDSLPGLIELGHLNEKGVCEIEFDVTDWLEAYPLGVLSITYIRPGETTVYPADGLSVGTVDDADILTWTVSNAVTAIAGSGSVVITLTEGDTIVKRSDKVQTIVTDGHAAAGEAPDPVADWIAGATSKLADVDHFIGETIEAAESANTAAGLTQDAVDRANAISGAMEGIALKWSAVDISASGLAAGAAPTASVTQDVGGTHLTVGIPKGDKGDKGDTGNVMYATFDIDFDTGELVMTIPDGYTGPTFAINDETGELEVSI